MEIKSLSFFTGNWLCKTDKYETEEFWQEPKADLMLGLNRTVSKEGKTAFEFLRIFQQKNEIFYAASPNGKPATLFKLITNDKHKFIFENSQHDFPQRIIYTFQTEKEMTARIEGEENGKLKFGEWKFSMVDSSKPSFGILIESEGEENGEI